MSNVLMFPARLKGVPITPAMRCRLEEAVQHALDAVEAMVAILDDLDGDPDREDAGDDEPSLGAPEGHVVQIGWARGGDDDRERDGSPCP